VYVLFADAHNAVDNTRCKDKSTANEDRDAPITPAYQKSYNCRAATTNKTTSDSPWQTHQQSFL